MRPVFFKLTLWNDPQKGAKRPAEWGACHGANREVRAGWMWGAGSFLRKYGVVFTRPDGPYIIL